MAKKNIYDDSIREKKERHFHMKTLLFHDTVWRIGLGVSGRHLKKHTHTKRGLPSFWPLDWSWIQNVKSAIHRVCAVMIGTWRWRVRWVGFNREWAETYECSPWTPPSTCADMVLFSNFSSPEYIIDLCNASDIYTDECKHGDKPWQIGLYSQERTLDA